MTKTINNDEELMETIDEFRTIMVDSENEGKNVTKVITNEYIDAIIAMNEGCKTLITDEDADILTDTLDKSEILEDNYRLAIKSVDNYIMSKLFSHIQSVFKYVDSERTERSDAESIIKSMQGLRTSITDMQVQNK